MSKRARGRASPANEKNVLTYSVPEAGALLGLGRNAAYEAARCGELPSIKIGSRIFVPKSALSRLLDRADAKLSETA